MLPGLHMHSSSRLEDLAAMLAALMRGGARADPLAPDVVVVQTPGVARWLALRLADHLGCAMGIKTLFPKNFVDWAAGRLLGAEKPEGLDRQALAWKIFAALPEAAGKSGTGELAGYLAQGDSLARWQLAARLADLFDRTLAHRPELAAAWEAGAEPGDWQANLWRTLASEMAGANLAKRLKDLESAPVPADFPRRIHLFALSTLPQLYLDFIRILGRSVEIHLFHFSPCAQWWGDLPRRRAAAVERILGGAEEGQGLLSSMGRQGSEFLGMLVDAGFEQASESYPAPSGNTELARLQEEIVRMKSVHEGDADGSIEVVSAAGAMREVEILRERLLALFEENPELSPRDVLVLFPDITRYAAFVEAVFGQGEEACRIPFAVADRRVREIPAVDAFSRLFALHASRRTLPEILAYCEHPAVAAHFGLDAEEAADMRGMLAGTNVRWGIDAQDREALGFGPEANNSWKSGVDSLALGAMMEPGAVFAGRAAYGPAEGDALAVAAKAAALFEAARKALRLLDGEFPPAQWPDRVRQAALLTVAGAEGDLQRGADKVLGAVEILRAQVANAGSDPVDARVVADALAEILAESDSPPGFLSGGVTFAELKPMRSVPAKVLCLLGMDAEAFPRQDKPLSFDRTAREHRPGDRSVREGDRYLFLETLLCARQKLYVSYSGVSQHGAADSPPSVVLAELLEYLSPGRPEARILCHPLQSFSRAYFSGGAFRSFSRADFDAARSGLAPGPVPAFAAEALPEKEEGAVLEFADLSRALCNPSRHFAENLGIAPARGEELPQEEEPLEMDRRDFSREERRMVEEFLAGGGADGIRAEALARGILPWGLAGESAAADAAGEALVFANAARPLLAAPPESVAGALTLPGAGLTLRGRLHPLHGGSLIRWKTAKIRAADRLEAWLAALFVGALREAGTATVGGSVVLLARDALLTVRAPENALARLDDLAALRRAGLCRPLPFFPESSLAAVTETARTRKIPLERAVAQWHRPPGNRVERSFEDEDPWNRLVWRGAEPISEASGFLEVAHRVWDGYYDHAEEVAR
jgi:exodeoxyribonuclease V gamma subunit